jgi:hypothetical protein
LADLDRDGSVDVLSGSWPGELYWFRGLGGGRYAAPAPLRGLDGLPIKIESASTVYACDWDHDGDLDLLIGDIRGRVFVVPGTAEPLCFGSAEQLEAGGSPIQTPGGDSAPIACDWDADGDLDLISGSGDGSVLLYRNGHSNASARPRLERPVPLLGEAARRPKHGPISQPGQRSKVHAVDWNRDGQLDLLVGDFHGLVTSPEGLGESEQRRWRELKDAEERAIAALTRLGDQLEAKSLEAERALPLIETLNARLTELSRELRSFSAERFEGHGFVWLLLSRARPGAKLY